MSTTADGSDRGAPDRARAGTRAVRWLEADRAARRAHRRAVTHQAASSLLGYPDQAFFERLPLVARAVAELPWGPVRLGLRDFCEHASVTPEQRLCEHHTNVFGADARRDPRLTRHCDLSPEEVVGTYAEAGWPVPEGEAPDHLAVVLEFTAWSDEGEALLSRLRPGLELLGEALRDHGTPYARVVDAVRASLAERCQDDWGPVRRRSPELRTRVRVRDHSGGTGAEPPVTGAEATPVPPPRNVPGPEGRTTADAHDEEKSDHGTVPGLSP